MNHRSIYLKTRQLSNSIEEHCLESNYRMLRDCLSSAERRSFVALRLSGTTKYLGELETMRNGIPFLAREPVFIAGVCGKSYHNAVINVAYRIVHAIMASLLQADDQYSMYEWTDLTFDRLKQPARFPDEVISLLVEKGFGLDYDFDCESVWETLEAEYETSRSLLEVKTQLADKLTSTSDQEERETQPHNGCPVHFDEQDYPIICGVRATRKLGSAQRSCVGALVDFYPGRLVGDELVEKSSVSGARRVLNRLFQSEEWQNVISTPDGKHGEGYGLVWPES